jgi:hypothetical protein
MYICVCVYTGDGIDQKSLYNHSPDKAPSYKGRVLLNYKIVDSPPARHNKDGAAGAGAEEEKKGDGKTPAGGHKPFRRKIRSLAPDQEPPKKAYCLKALIATGTDLPSFRDAMSAGIRKQVKREEEYEEQGHDLPITLLYYYTIEGIS